VANPLQPAAPEDSSMVMRVLHSAPARVVQALVGTWFFVEGSVAQGIAGLLMITVGSVLVIIAGADVFRPDPLLSGGEAARAADHALGEASRGRAA